MLSKRPYLSAVLLLVLGLAFGASLVAGFGSWRAVNLAFGASDPKIGGPLPNLPNDASLQAMNSGLIAVAKAVQPTVVSITVRGERPTASSEDNSDQNPFRHFFNFPFGNGDEDEGGGGSAPFQFPQPGPEEGLGSGVIITSDGYILTNNHVVENAAKKGGVTVKLTDKRVFSGRVVGTDPTTDIAVVKIDATNLPVAAVGNSDNVAVGQMVIAVGNPLGLESTITSGIISSLSRSIDIFDRRKTSGYGIADFIQTDAAINPGNSGGGLFDLKGAVIGINSAIASRTGYFAGYGFAVPINMAQAVALDIIKTGKVNRGYIGVVIRAVDQTDAEALGLDRPRGVRVDGISPGGAGEAAGLEKNDVILSVNGREVNEANQLQGIIGMHRVGDDVTLRVWRDGRETEKRVKLRARADVAESTSKEPTDDERETADASKESATMDEIGLTVRNLTSAEKDKYDTKTGVYVTRVLPGTEAYDRGLGGTNRVITMAAKQTVKNVADFEKIVNQNKGKAIGLTVKDDKGDTHFISIKVPVD